MNRCRIEACHSRQRGVLLVPDASRMSQVARTGTSVVERMYEETMAKPTAIESGMKSCFATPAMKNDGTNTERTHSMASNRGMAVFRHASTTAFARDMPDCFA